MATRKRHIKYLYIFKRSAKSSRLDIGIVDDELHAELRTYIEYSKDFKFVHSQRITKEVLKGYFIDTTSRVCYNDVIDFTKSSLLQYLLIISSNQKFNMRKCNIDMMMRRINVHHGFFIYDADRTDMKKIWDRLVALQKCPWIDKAIDAHTKMMSSEAAYAAKIVLIGLYFIAVKTYLSQNTTRYMRYGTTSVKKIKELQSKLV